MKNNLIIVGASVRAAAESAWRTGFRPYGCDLFADRDLREIAEAYRITDYPQGVLSLLEDLPEASWMFTGAWENYPDLVERISQRRKLLGNGAQVLQNVRDPFRVQKILDEARLMTAHVRRGNDPPPDLGKWLLKPIRSGAGVGISNWPGGEPRKRLGGSLALPDRGKSTIEEKCGDDDARFFQEFIAGVSHSAVYFATEHRCQLWGVTRQLVGMNELGAKTFSYCGSYGPIVLPEEVVQNVEKTGDVLASAFGLRGIFGVDFILKETDAIPVEINPRYPSSAEVLEYTTGKSAIALHVACFDKRHETVFQDEIGYSSAFAGKAILFAPHRLQVSDLWALRTTDGTDEVPSLADIPEAGTVVETGHPICTVLVRGENPEKCLEKLSDKVFETQNILGIQTKESLLDALVG